MGYRRKIVFLARWLAEVHKDPHLSWSTPVYNVVGVVKSFFRTPQSSRAGSGVKGGSTLFVEPFIARPLTPRTARHNGLQTKRKLRPAQDSFTVFDQGSCPSNPAVKLLPPTMYSISTANHDSQFELPSCATRGGRALNQLADRISPTTGVTGLPCMRAGETGCAASRSFQYSRTANFRAIATFATAPPRRNFNR
jgi:hypothetical protein